MRKIYDYGQIIRAKRQSKNIKAVDLAKELGITPAYLSLIESNQRKPDGDLLLRIQDLLELQKEGYFAKLVQKVFLCFLILKKITVV